jgi:hypothetical protein
MQTYGVFVFRFSAYFLQWEESVPFRLTNTQEEGREYQGNVFDYYSVEM